MSSSFSEILAAVQRAEAVHAASENELKKAIEAERTAWDAERKQLLSHIATLTQENKLQAKALSHATTNKPSQQESVPLSALAQKPVDTHALTLRKQLKRLNYQYDCLLQANQDELAKHQDERKTWRHFKRVIETVVAENDAFRSVLMKAEQRISDDDSKQRKPAIQTRVPSMSASSRVTRGSTRSTSGASSVGSTHSTPRKKNRTALGPTRVPPQLLTPAHRVPRGNSPHEETSKSKTLTTPKSLVVRSEDGPPPGSARSESTEQTEDTHIESEAASDDCQKTERESFNTTQASTTIKRDSELGPAEETKNMHNAASLSSSRLPITEMPPPSGNTTLPEQVSAPCVYPLRKEEYFDPTADDTIVEESVPPRHASVKFYKPDIGVRDRAMPVASRTITGVDTLPLTDLAVCRAVSEEPGRKVTGSSTPIARLVGVQAPTARTVYSRIDQLKTVPEHKADEQLVSDSRESKETTSVPQNASKLRRSVSTFARSSFSHVSANGTTSRLSDEKLVGLRKPVALTADDASHRLVSQDVIASIIDEAKAGRVTNSQRTESNRHRYIVPQSRLEPPLRRQQDADLQSRAHMNTTVKSDSALLPAWMAQSRQDIQATAGTKVSALGDRLLANKGRSEDHADLRKPSVANNLRKSGADCESLDPARCHTDIQIPSKPTKLETVPDTIQVTMPSLTQVLQKSQSSTTDTEARTDRRSKKRKAAGSDIPPDIANDLDIVAQAILQKKKALVPSAVANQDTIDWSNARVSRPDVTAEVQKLQRHQAETLQQEASPVFFRRSAKRKRNDTTEGNVSEECIKDSATANLVRQDQEDEDFAGQDFMRELHKRRREELKAEPLKYKGRGAYAQQLTKDNTVRAVEINPEGNAGFDFAYQETVRDQHARKQMHGVDCDCCRGYYEAMTRHLPVEERRAFAEQLANENSRHRMQFEAPPSPPGYWMMGFPASHQTKRLNEEAKEMDAKRQEEKRKEADKCDGRFRYKAN